MNDNKKFWQRFAKLYSPFMEKGNKELYEKIKESSIPYITCDTNVLELACGSGQLSFRLARYAKLWEATDFAENMIAEAKKHPKSKNLHFSVEDATNLPYADGSFDAVVIANALHIMPEPDLAMSEICRVLKEGGTLIAPSFIHGEGSRYRFRIKMMNLIGFKTYSKWNAVEFVKYIESYGYKIQEQTVLGSNLTPLCCLIATRTKGTI